MVQLSVAEGESSGESGLETKIRTREKVQGIVLEYDWPKEIDLILRSPRTELLGICHHCGIG